MRQIVTTVGTPVQLASDATVYSRIFCQALFTNTGYIALDKTSAVRASSGSQNAPLIKGGTSLETWSFPNARPSDIWMDVTVANDGVAFVVE